LVTRSLCVVSTTMRYSPPRPERLVERSATPPLGLPSPSEFHRTEPATLGSTALLRFRPFSTCGRRSPALSGLPHPTPSVFRDSHPPDGFLLLRPSGLISYRYALGVFPSGPFPFLEPSVPLGTGPLRGVPNLVLGSRTGLDTITSTRRLQGFALQGRSAT